MTVCLILEGTYPYVRGGVAGWTHELIRALPDIDFYLLTISPAPNQHQRYQLPTNVVGMHDIVLESDSLEVRTEPLDESTLHSALAFLRYLAGTGEIDASDADFARSLIRTLGDEEHLAARLLHSVDGWRYVVGEYLRNNPYYPFAEYYWNWFNAHSTVLKMFEVALPEADLYHSVSTGYAGMLGARASASGRGPFVLTEHGIYHRERFIDIEANTQLKGKQRDEWDAVFRSLSRLAYITADRVITLFEENRRLELAMGAPPSKSIVIPNGINYGRFSGVARTRRAGRHVGLVGRVVPIKDIKTYIAVAKIVTAGRPDVRFYCIGPTEEDERYHRECIELVDSLGLSDQFEFTGSVDVTEYYSFLDCVVLTSLSEAQPLVILEALAAGVPFVATNVGDVSGLLAGDARFIATPKDAAGIAARIEHILDNPEEIAAWVRDRQSAIEQNYTQEAVYAAYDALYRQALEESWRVSASY